MKGSCSTKLDSKLAVFIPIVFPSNLEAGFRSVCREQLSRQSRFCARMQMESHTWEKYQSKSVHLGGFGSPLHETVTHVA